MKTSAQGDAAGQLPRIRQRPAAVLAGSLSLTVLVVLLALVNAVTIENRFFYLSSDFSLAMVVTAAFFLIGGVSALRAFSVGGSEAGRLWLGLGLIGCLLGAEAVLGLHDRLEEIDALEKYLFVAYPLVGLLILAAFYRPVVALGSPVSTLLIGAALALVVSQAAGAVISIEPELWTPLFNLLMLAEEGLEMISGSLFLTSCVLGGTRGAAASPSQRH